MAGVRDHALQQMEAAWPGRGALREGVGEDHIYVTQTGAVGPDCVVFQDLPEKFQGLVDGLVPPKTPNGTPVYRCKIKSWRTCLENGRGRVHRRIAMSPRAAIALK